MSTLAERTGRFLAHAKIEPSEVVPPPTVPPVETALDSYYFSPPGHFDDATQDALERVGDRLDGVTQAWVASQTTDFPCRVSQQLYVAIRECLTAIVNVAAKIRDDDHPLPFSLWQIVTTATELARKIMPVRVPRGFQFGLTSASGIGSTVFALVSAIRRRRAGVPARFIRQRSATVSPQEMRRLQVDGEQACRAWNFVDEQGVPLPDKLTAYGSGDDAALDVPQFITTKLPNPDWPRQEPHEGDIQIALSEMSKQLLR